MGSTSLQVCMDSSNWLQGGGSMMHEESTGMDSSSSPSAGDMLACSRPLMERRLRPQHDLALKCPRCDSAHTKFCYYNNYSLSQPRYFCKTCRRYWTKGGTLRNIPVGGGCRKNKKVSSSKKSSNLDQLHHPIDHNPSSSSPSSHMILPTDLHLSFPETQFSQLTSIFGSNVGLGLDQDLMEAKYNNFGLLENPIRPIDFLERKIEAIVGNSRNHEFMSGNNGELALVNGYEEYVSHQQLAMSNTSNYQAINICSPYGISLDGNNNGGHHVSFMDNSQKLMLPYGEGHHDQDANSMDVKPSPKLLSIDWQQDQGCSSSSGKDSFGYLGNMASWTNVMNGYHHHAPSTTNSLV